MTNTEKLIKRIYTNEANRVLGKKHDDIQIEKHDNIAYICINGTTLHKIPADFITIQANREGETLQKLLSDGYIRPSELIHLTGNLKSLPDGRVLVEYATADNERYIYIDKDKLNEFDEDTYIHITETNVCVVYDYNVDAIGIVLPVKL